jgi:NADPH:quinone reductase-like Zn-dependent oxidoreductase
MCVLVGSTEELRAQLAGYEPKAGAPRLVTMLARFTSDDLTTLAALLEAGKIVPVIEKRFRLDQTADAMAHVGSKRARGKVIITVVETSR